MGVAPLFRAASAHTVFCYGCHPPVQINCIIYFRTMQYIFSRPSKKRAVFYKKYCVKKSAEDTGYPAARDLPADI